MGLLKEVAFKAGVIKDDAVLAARGYWTDSNRIRFVNGLPQKIGGWVKRFTSTFDGKCRGMLAWQGNDNAARLAIGTHRKLYALIADIFFNITPIRASGSLSNPFTVTVGSTTVSVSHTSHGLSPGDPVFYSGATPVSNITISGDYAVNTVIDGSNYTLEQATVASENLIVRSEEINDAAWVKTGGTVTPNSTTDPLGGSTADLFTENTSSGNHSIRTTFNATAGVNYTAVIYVKDNGRGFVAFSYNSPQFLTHISIFNLSTGLFVGGFGGVARWAVNVGSGWWRLGITVTCDTSGTGTINCWLYNGNITYTGDGVSGLYFWGGAVFRSSTLLNYVKTTTTAITSPVTGGGTVNYIYDLAPGREDGVLGTGYGVGPYGTGTYGTARSSFILLPPRTWSLDQWGQYLVACPRNGSIYEWQLDTAVRAQLVANAPTPNTAILVTDERHLVALGAGGDKMLLQWCDRENNTVWTASDQTTAGSRRLTGGSEILFGIRTRGTNLIFTDASVWAMTFVSGGGVFGFEQIAAGSSGIVGPQAADEVNGVVYWMGKNDFYQYDGVVRPIPNSRNNRRFVFDNLTQAQISKVFCFHNSLGTEVWWLYPTAAENNRYIKVNLDDYSWDVGLIGRTAAVDRGVFDLPIMAGVDGYLYSHETGVDDDGNPMGESIESAPFMIGDGDRVMDILSVMPDFKNLTGTLTLTLLTRYYPQDTQTEETTDVITSTLPQADMRASGRQAQIKLAANQVGNNWRVGTFRFDLQPGSER